MIALHLTASEAAKAALKAHDENRLTAQHGDGCIFYDKATGHCCAIGAGLPSVLIAYIDQCGCLDAGPEWLVKHAQLVTTDDYEALVGLMTHHDKWHDAQRVASHASLVGEAAGRLHDDFLTYARRLAQ